MSEFYKLLICGSRKSTHEMNQFANHAVLRAKANNWHIVVGDAYGIDHAVIYACLDYAVPFYCYGITPTARCYSANNPLSFRWDDIATYIRVNGNYLQRDRVMVEVADRVFAIWNGSSRGTKYTYDYAINTGKPADIRTFRSK